MNEKGCVRVLCCVQSHQQARVHDLLATAGDFEIAGSVKSAKACIEVLEGRGADVLILDERMPGMDELHVRSQLLDGSGTPTMLFVEDPERFKLAYTPDRSVTVVGRKLLAEQDEFKRAHLRARLNTLVSRVSARQRTVTSRNLQASLDAIRKSSQDEG